LSLRLRTELFMAMEDYESKGLKKWDNGFDITALDNGSNDKILLRVITKPDSKSGWIGVDTVDKMLSKIEDDGYDKGILFGKRFTEAARRRLREEGIQMLSNEIKCNFEAKRLFFLAENLVDDLCKAKCGKIPRKESECKGHSDGRYSCETRQASDNASFHFERGWKDLLQKDVLRLLSMHRSAMSRQKS
jgi:hypothetical protein